MSYMDVIVELMKLLLPAGLVLYSMYLTVKAFLNKEFEKKIIDLKTRNSELVLPIRLQAYERMCLFLERITPNNLIVRLNDPAYSAKQFQQVLLHEIREEFNHNLSQQVYMSDKAWMTIKKTMEDIVVIINQSGNELKEDASGLDLAKGIFEKVVLKEIDMILPALSFLKDEIRQVF